MSEIRKSIDQMVEEKTNSPDDQLLKKTIGTTQEEPVVKDPEVQAIVRENSKEDDLISQEPIQIAEELTQVAEEYDPKDYILDTEEIKVATIADEFLEFGVKIFTYPLKDKIAEIDQKMLQKANEQNAKLTNTIDLSDKGKGIKFDLDTQSLQNIEETLSRIQGTDILSAKNLTTNVKRGGKKIYNFLDNPKRDQNGNIDALEFNKIVNEQFGGDVVKAAKAAKLEDLIAEANRIGLTDIVTDIAYRQGKGEVLPVKTYVAMVLKADLIYERMTQIHLKKAGAYTKEDVKEYYQLLNLYNKFVDVEPVTRSEYGKSLNLLNHFEIGTDTQLSMTKGERKIAEAAAKKLESEPDGQVSVEVFEEIMNDVRQISQGEYTRWFKQTSVFGLYRAWEEFFVNQLLFNYVTPAVNFLGGESFALVRAAENYVAATIDVSTYPLKKSIQYVTGDKNIIERGARFNEANAYVTGLLSGHYDALFATYRFLRTGERIGNNKDKLDLSVRKYVVKERFLDSKFMNTKTGKIVGGGIDYLGVVNRAGGTILNSGDQFVRSATLTAGIKKEARRAYNDALANGKSYSEAKAIEANTLEKLNIDQAKRIQEDIDTGTFLKDLPNGIFKDLQKISNYPGFKIIQPYHKAITNIFFEASKRNPFTAALMPSVRREIFSGDPRTKQLAFAKMTMLTSSSYLLASQSYGSHWANFTADGEEPNVMLTGHPPMDSSERETWFRAGYKPFSFGIKQEDGTYKWISYSGWDPISGFLMMSADMSYAAHKSSVYEYENGETDLERASPNLIAALTNGYYNYLSNQHFAETMATISAALNAGPAEAESILTELGAKASTGVLRFFNAGVPYFGSSLPRYMQMMEDPSFYNNRMTQDQYENGMFSNLLQTLAGVEDTDPVPSFINQFYKELNTMLFNAGYKKDVPKDLNIWGESDIDFAQRGRNTPFMTYDIDRSKRFRAVDEWMSAHHVHLEFPNEKIHNGFTHLFRDQHRDLILFMNPDNDLSGVSDMLEEIQNLILSPSFQEMTFVAPDGKVYNDVKSQIDAVRNVFNRYKSEAIIKLEDKYPELVEKRETAGYKAMSRGTQGPAQ